MLASFRSFFQSRLGVIFTLGFLALIAIAFASADVTGSMFGGVSGADRVAKVGSSKIGNADLRVALNNAFERERQDNPTLTMQQFLNAGALDQILDDLISQEAVSQFGKAHGIAVSHRLVDSEIIKIPAFLGPDGKFSETAYRQLIAQRGLTDAIVRDDIAKGLLSRQILTPAMQGSSMPTTAVSKYVSLLKERRVGEIALIPSVAYAPATAPDDATLTKFYTANKARYTQPERRSLRFAVFDEAALKNVPAPTEAEVAQRYKANAAAFAPSESRTVTQVIVPTEAAAKAVAAEVADGKSLEAAATAKGLAPTKLEKVSRQSLAGQASQAIADAVFATAQGKLAAPGKSPLGWHLVRVDAIVRNPGKTLDQARRELLAQLAIEKRRSALSDISARIEQELDKGGSLADVAKELNLQIATTEPLLKTGEVFGKPGQKAPDMIAPAVQAAFAMEREGEPQLAELQAGTKFIVYEVGQITPAAPAPLAQIKQIVARDYVLDSGSSKARAAGEKVLAQLAKGTPLEAALASLGVKTPAPEKIDMSREMLMASGQQVPAPLALLFSMAKNSSKRLEAPGKNGWYIVTVKDIIPGQIQVNDPQVAAASRDLGRIVGQEYVQQLRAAIRAEVGAKRNETAIAAVRKDLVGAGQ